jgi:hypothetical protein
LQWDRCPMARAGAGKAARHRFAAAGADPLTDEQVRQLIEEGRRVSRASPTTPALA